MKTKRMIYSILILAMAMVLSVAGHRAEAAQVYGTLSNFDLYNTIEQEVNDMHLVLSGEGLTCDDIYYYYIGWGVEWDGSDYTPTGGCDDLGGGQIQIN